MSFDFGWNMNYGIGVSSLRTIGIIILQITSLKSVTDIQRIGFRRNSGYGTPIRNIRSFGLFDIGASDFSNRSVLWNGASKCEGENPVGNRIFKKSGRDNNFEVENVGRKIL